MNEIKDIIHDYCIKHRIEPANQKNFAKSLNIPESRVSDYKRKNDIESLLFAIRKVDPNYIAPENISFLSTKVPIKIQKLLNIAFESPDACLEEALVNIINRSIFENKFKEALKNKIDEKLFLGLIKSATTEGALVILREFIEELKNEKNEVELKNAKERLINSLVKFDMKVSKKIAHFLTSKDKEEAVRIVEELDDFSCLGVFHYSDLASEAVKTSQNFLNRSF